MNENIETNVKKLRPFTRFLMTIGELPTSYLMSMTYYEQIIWFTKYLQEQVIPAINNNAEAIEEIQEFLKTLDLQDEVNKKLDEMAEDGTLINLIKPYIDPLIESQNIVINNFIDDVNDTITEQNFKINAITNANPLVASSTSEMTDTTRIYVNTTDGNWYYYDVTSWQVGGIYQSSGISDLSITYNMINDQVNKDNIIEPTWINGAICSSENQTEDEGTIITSVNYRRSSPILLKKGMIIEVDTSISEEYNAISVVTSSNTFLSTGRIAKGRRTYLFKANSDLYVSVCRNYNATCYISIYDEKFFDKKDKENIGLLIGGYTSSELNTSNLDSGTIVNNHPWSSSPVNSKYIRSNLIHLYKGNILKINCTAPNTINVFSVYDANLNFISGKQASNSIKLHDYNYVAENECYLIISHDLSKINTYKVTFYESYETYENDPIFWNQFYIINNEVTFTADDNYVTSNELLLKAGDVIDYFSRTPTNNSYKISFWSNGENTGGRIENNYDTSSEYYVKCWRNSYVATEPVFVRITDKTNDLPVDQVEILINKYENVKDINIYNKIVSVIGDSYVANQNMNIGYTWHSKITSKYGSKYNNYGINGNGLVSTQATGTPVVNRLNEIDSESDLIIVVGGKNDYNTHLPISDFKTGLNSICQNLINTFYNKKIVFFTPWDSYGINDNASIKLYEYVDAIKEVCSQYSIPVYDSYHHSNMYMWNNDFKAEFNQSSTDISHLNNKGHNRFMNQADRFIISL